MQECQGIGHIALNDNLADEVNKDKRDISIKMVSEEMHGGGMKNQLVLDVSSTSIAHHSWHDNYRIQIVTGEHVLCDSTMSQLVKNKFQCMLDNNMLSPGDNAFSIVIYSADTHQTYFEKVTHFWFDGADDLHPVSNVVWHWSDYYEGKYKGLLLAAALLSIGSSLHNIVKSWKPVRPSQETIVLPPAGPYTKPKPPPPPPPSKKPDVSSSFHFASMYPLLAYRPTRGSKSNDIDTIAKAELEIPKPVTKIQVPKVVVNDNVQPVASVVAQRNETNEIAKTLLKVGTIIAIGVGVSVARVVVIKGLGLVFGIIPSTFNSLNRKEKSSGSLAAEERTPIATSSIYSPSNDQPHPQEHHSPSALELLSTKTDKLFHMVTLPDGTKIFKSSVWWLEWLGTTVLLTNTGNPYFLKNVRKYFSPDDPVQQSSESR